MSKILKCPNCNYKMVIIWYNSPVDLIKKFVDEKKVYYRGLEDKNVDRDSDERIIYHCYNCNRSYSKNLKKYVEEKKTFDEIVKQAQVEINNIVVMLADDVINDIADNTKQELKRKPEFSHFGFGLYIRNKYIYINEKIKYRIEADDLSYKVYNKIIEKLTSRNFGK